MKLSIVIPVFNEKNTIQELLKKVDSVDFGDTQKEIIIVDDGSTDGTKEILKSLAGRFKVFFHEKNSGKGMALRTGFNNATGEIIVVQDADLEYDPNDLKVLLDKMKEPEVLVVYGSRRFNRNYHYFEGRYSGHVYAVGGIFLTWLTNLLYGINISDEPTCYKMFRANLLLDLDLKCKRFEFCPEVTAKVAKRGIKIHEVPISYYPRHKNEGKKIKIRDGIEAIITLLKYKFKR